MEMNRFILYLFRYFKEIYEDENLIATHADYRLFAVINHHGGSSDVGKNKLLNFNLINSIFIQDIIHQLYMMLKVTHGGHMMIHQ
jgi:hypothetical protein